ncbi:MAG: hypothetical protein AMJ62_03825 [Myxococcales bacterium SG8_38]|nr:MAG: hypothetical protein AMJ62_03825 [Myxococcales bacterium SG8_38]
MSTGRFDQRHETPKWRTFWLLLGFAGLVAIGIVTVGLPELEDQREEQGSSQAETSDTSNLDEPLQE